MNERLLTISNQLTPIMPHLLGFSVEEWWAASPHHNKPLNHVDICAALHELYDRIPGEKLVNEPITVIVKPGKSIANHQHPQWTAVYYIDLGDPPVATIADIDHKEVRLVPEPGDLIIFPPKTWHRVETSKSKTRRLSIALQWVTEGMRCTVCGVMPPSVHTRECRLQKK